MNVEEKGFSLLEVLIALMVFAIGILGIVSLQGISLMATDYSGMAGIARILAQDQLSRLGSVPYTTSPALDDCAGVAFCHADSGGGVPGAQSPLDFTGQANPQGRFLRDWTVTVVAPSGFTPESKVVTVRVRWSDVAGGSQQFNPAGFNRRVEMTSTKVDL